MVAISIREPGILDVAAREAGAPGPGDILLRVLVGGICGSDMHILHGTNPFAAYPRIIGHEFAGVVEALGDGVSGLAVGDHVVADPAVSCGRCYACRIGRSNVCADLAVFGVHRDGGFRDRMVLPAASAVKVDKALAIAVAALAEPFSIAANVLSRTFCAADDTVLVYGAGTVGLTVLQVAKLKGARVIVADPDRDRLARAESFGADRVLVSGTDDIPAEVSAENDGLGPSLVIDGAGVPALFAEACRVACPAGRIGLLGFSPAPSPVSQQEIVRKELTIAGSRLSRRLLPEVVGWLEAGRLSPAAMITQTFAAKDARAAFALVDAEPHRTIKVQLAFGG